MRRSIKDCFWVEESSDMTRRPLDDDVGGEGRLRDTSPALHRAWALTLAGTSVVKCACAVWRGWTVDTLDLTLFYRFVEITKKIFDVYLTPAYLK